MKLIGPESDRQGSNLVGYLALGHLAIHWFQQLYPIIIPSIKSSLGLSDIQVGALSSVKQFTTGPLMFPAGMLSDFFRPRTALILGASFAFLGVSHFLVSLTPSFIWILPAVGLLGIGTALWHPAAMASLSLRFPDQRGTVLAWHGVGASVGDTIAPLGIGGLLLILSWQDLLQVHMIPAAMLALLVWRCLGATFKGEQAERPTVGSYWVDVKAITRNRVLLAMVGVSGMTSMARISVLTFLPIYLQDDLGYSTFTLGVYIGLLHVMGVASQPIMGALSDRVGRKTVLMPSLLLFGLLYLAIAIASPGLQLSIVIGALGLFFYALATLVQTTVFDVASAKTQASVMGISTILGQVMALPGPIVAGVLVTRYGTEAAFVWAGAVTLFVALILAPIDVPKSTRPTPRMSG